MFMESYSEYERRVKVWVTIHASKSLSEEDVTCSSNSSNNNSSSNNSSSGSSSNNSSRGVGGTVKGGTVKGNGTGEAFSADTSGVATVVVVPAGAATDGSKKTVSTPSKTGSVRAGVEKGVNVGAGGGGGGGGGGSGAPTPGGGKRREDAPRKTVKDRQKEAKKKGLKRL